MNIARAVNNEQSLTKSYVVELRKNWNLTRKNAET